MLHKAIKFAYAVLLTASAAMAFVVMLDIDETAVAGAPFVISFDRIDNGSPGPRAAEMVETFARDHRVNIGRLYNDPRNGSNRRIYLSVGNPQAESAGWLVHGYADMVISVLRQLAEGGCAVVIATHSKHVEGNGDSTVDLRA